MIEYSGYIVIAVLLWPWPMFMVRGVEEWVIHHQRAFIALAPARGPDWRHWRVKAWLSIDTVLVVLAACSEAMYCEITHLL